MQLSQASLKNASSTLILYTSIFTTLSIFSNTTLANNAAPKFDLTLRNYYFNRDYRHENGDARAGNRDGKRKAWTQSFLFDYQSPYWHKLIGGDLSIWNTLKLDGGKGTGKNNLTITQEDGDQVSYSSLGVALIKFNLENFWNTTVKAGRQTFETPLAMNSDSRTQPSAFSAVHIHSQPVDRFNINLLGIYEAKDKDDSGFDDIHYEYGFAISRDKIEHAYTLSMDYTYESGLYLAAQALTAKDAYNAYHLEASYSFPLNDWLKIDLAGLWERQKDTGNFNDDNPGSVGIDNDLFSFSLAFRLGDYSKFTVISQNLTGDSGFDYFAEGDPWWFNSIQYSDFNFEDETSWQTRFDYDFSGIGFPGLTGLIRYGYANDAKTFDSSTNEEYTEWERDLELRYKVPSGQLKGMDIRVRHATYRSHRGMGNGGALDEFRIIVNYTLPLI
ncbi:OprD family outer membrane porin [Zooshikella harenae]|uniref:OprD family outer membrane porin n=1 Tax=Zooshikella harenae TaxID=2827238 RepID=A0ABS5Z8A8_9GAMM|nr:OprD family outer membrane porin [Zooshikella harenae]MBU2710287.1 OprD family outer membrane porin [Zooshikella harenae]